MRNILCLGWKDIKHERAGGAEKVIHEYLKGLVSLGYRVTQVSTNSNNNPEYESIDGVDIHRLFSIHSIYFLFPFYYLLFLKGKYDAIIDHAGGIPLLSPLYVWKLPILFFTHHVGDREWEEYFHQRIGLGRVGNICKWIYNTVVLGLYTNKKTLTVSQGTADELTKLGFQDICILPNTTNYDRVKTVAKKGNILTVVGRIVPNKQFSHAIEVLHQLHKQGRAYHLNIVGSTQDSIELQKIHGLVKQYTLDNYITFHGKVDDTQLVDIRGQTQYALMVSDKEGFGMTVLEANSRGVPVIGYDIPGVNEVIHDGINGYLVKKNDSMAIVDCILNQDNYDTLVQSTIEFIQQYPNRVDNIQQLDALINKNS